MQAMQSKLDAASNDLANANTTGYKRLRVGFSDLLYEQGGRPTTSVAAQIGSGARAVMGGRNFEQGTLNETGVPTDVAIEGPGFLKVKLADGRDALTRDGNLHVDANRRLVTSSGGVVNPTITIPEGVADSELSIGADGTVLAKGTFNSGAQLESVLATAERRRR
jgi:flagellar basal-body rod protein FlgG